jgi:hypothetical protein
MACQILSFSSKRPSHIRLTCPWQYLLINIAEGSGREPINAGTAAHEAVDAGIWPNSASRIPLSRGNSDLYFELTRPIAEAIAHLKCYGITIESGPRQRFGANAPVRVSISTIQHWTDYDIA